MTQKSGLFKGQQKKDKAANRHGKDVHLRKGRVFKAPLKKNKELEANQEVTKFINAANETKAATKACKEGAQLCLLKTPIDSNATPSRKKFQKSLKPKSNQ